MEKEQNGMDPEGFLQLPEVERLKFNTKILAHVWFVHTEAQVHVVPVS